MKELTSNHDDMDKRLAIFFGLGAFLMSSLVGLLRGYTLEGFLLQGVVVLVLASLLGYGYGIWVRQALLETTPEDALPGNVERRRNNADTLDEGSVVMPMSGSNIDLVVDEEPGQAEGQVRPYTMEEFTPQAPVAAAAAAPAAPADELGDLPPPPVPAWLK
jgi:hypothetical protein